MPKILNTGDNSAFAYDTGGVLRRIYPGKTIESYDIRNLADDLAVVSPIPYFSPCPAEHSVSSSGADDNQLIELQEDTDGLEIYNNGDATITLYFNSMSNDQTLTVHPYSIRKIEHIVNKIESIFMEFDTAGSCTVSEIRRVI